MATGHKTLASYDQANGVNLVDAVNERLRQEAKHNHITPPKQEEKVMAVTQQTTQIINKREILSILKFCKLHKLPYGKVTEYVKTKMPDVQTYNSGYILTPADQDKLLTIKQAFLSHGNKVGRPAGSGSKSADPEILNRLAHIEVLLEKLVTELGVKTTHTEPEVLNA
jgi:hypothetical protein